MDLSADSSPSSMIRDKGAAQTLVALLCLWCGLPLIDARQTYCGCRICSSCYSLLESPTHDFVCKKCNGNINGTFIDRAVVHELKRVSFPCYNEKCPWEGSNVDYRDHILRCRYMPIVCPHEGCGYAVEKEVLDKHIKNCPFKLITCRHCGERIPSKYIKDHLCSQLIPVQSSDNKLGQCVTGLLSTTPTNMVPGLLPPSATHCGDSVLLPVPLTNCVYHGRDSRD